MKIWYIWVTDGYAPDPSYWLVEAWDDDSTMENEDGWNAAVEKAKEGHGADNVRITTGFIDWDKVVSAFQPADISL